MENLLNPVIVAVLLLCVLCLLKVNVLLSMLVSLFVAGLIGGLPLISTGDEVSIMSSVIAGFSGNAETALAYVSARCMYLHQIRTFLLCIRSHALYLLQFSEYLHMLLL